MADNVKLNTFPRDEREALAYLYIESQDLTEATPEQIACMYKDAYNKICGELNRIRNEEREELLKSQGRTSFYN